MEINNLKEQLYIASSVWIDYKGLQVITGWSKSKANQVFKKLQRERSCANVFDTRKARTTEILKVLGYDQKTLVDDLKYQLELDAKLNNKEKSNEN